MQNESGNFDDDLMNSGFTPFSIDELTKETILGEDIFKYIFSIDDALVKTRTIVNLQERAKDLGVSRSFDKMLKAHQTDYVQKIKQAGSETIKFTNPPINNLKCGKWKCNDTGVQKITLTNFEAQVVTACPHPIMPVEILTNIETETEKVKIAFFKHSKWQSVTVDRSMVANKSNIIQLADRGIEVNSDNAKELVSYIADIIALNVKEIPVSRSTDHLGWIGPEFAPYTKDLKYDGDNDFRDIYDSIKSKGDYENWKSFCKALRSKNKVIRLLMASSFASPLNKLLGISPYIVHVWGGTGTAKTVAVMCAMSVWGNPDLGKLVRTLNSTQVALARYASFVHDIPFAGDELQVIKNRWDTLDNLVMYLAEGVDRARGKAYGGMEILKNWNNNFIFTGEEPITKSTSGGGVKNRVFEIEVTEKLVEDGNYTANFFRENYGYAGEEFIKNLPNVKDLQERYRQIMRAIIELGITTDKQAMASASILLADELSTALIFNDEKLSIEDIKEYVHKASEVSVANRAYEIIIDWINKNINRFKEDSVSEVWGRYSESENCCYINKLVLDDMLQERQIDFNAIKKDLAKDGKIERDKDGKFAQNVWTNGKTKRFVKILFKNDSDEKNKDFPF